jgi:perosamine synthetase
MTNRISWWNTTFDEEESDAVVETIAANYLNEGPKTRLLEQKFAELINISHVSAVPNGTVALALCLWASGIKPGDEVLIPDLTFIATASAVKMVNAVPILVDVNPADGNINVDIARSKITTKTRALIAVHINGRVVDVKALMGIKKDYNIKLIGDCAQALGSDFNNQSIPSFFDISAISLAPSKIMSTGQGGLVLTSSSELYEKVVRLKDHGRLSRSEEIHKEPGFNFKFTDLQASVGLSQLNKLPARIIKARDDFIYYKNALKDIPEIKFLDSPGKGFTPLWVDAISEHRNELLSFLNNSNIELRPFWGALHRQWIGGKDEQFPVASKLSDQGFWFPSGPACQEKDMAIVCKKTHDFFGAK